MVSAWVSDIRMVLEQIKTDAKSNEIIAIPDLIKMLDLKGAVVKTDAVECQKSLKGGIQTKRLKAAWHHDYILKILAA